MRNKKSYNDTTDYMSRQSPFWYDSPIFELKELSEKYKNNDNKVLYPYVPIRIVALLEAYFQQNYAIIIDNNKKCRENCKELFKENIKFDLEIISSIENGQLSSGEYISLLLPCNSFDDIIKNYKSLTKDIITEDPFVDKEMVKEMIEIFKYRHVFCHEGCGTNNLSNDKLIVWLNTTIDFITHMNGIFLKIRQIDFSTIEQFAIDEFEKADKELTIIINKLKEIYRVTELFDKVDYLEEFKDYRSKRAKIEITDYCEGDDINVAKYYWSMTAITQELIYGLNKRYRNHLRYFDIRTKNNEG